MANADNLNYFYPSGLNTLNQKLIKRTIFEGVRGNEQIPQSGKAFTVPINRNTAYISVKLAACNDSTTSYRAMGYMQIPEMAKNYGIAGGLNATIDIGYGKGIGIGYMPILGSGLQEGDYQLTIYCSDNGGNIDYLIEIAAYDIDQNPAPEPQPPIPSDNNVEFVWALNGYANGINFKNNYKKIIIEGVEGTTSYAIGIFGMSSESTNNSNGTLLYATNVTGSTHAFGVDTSEYERVLIWHSYSGGNNTTSIRIKTVD